MEVRPYSKNFTEATKILHNSGVLARLPVQFSREDLVYDEGVDIKLYFKGMTPAKFREFSDVILLAAYQEAQRYEDVRYKFAKLEVELHRTPKGRKSVGPERTYQTGMNPDSETMVYGEEALGFEMPEEYKKRPFLKNKVEAILDLPAPYVDYLNKQRPYRVLSLTICIRAGLREGAREFARIMKERAELKSGSTPQLGEGSNEE